MRGRSGNRHVRAEMELRPQEDDPQEQGHKTYTLSAARHVLTKKKLKMDWLQGQVNYPPEVLISSHRRRLASSPGARLGTGFMNKKRNPVLAGERGPARLSPGGLLLPGEVGLGFGQFRAVGTSRAHRSELRVERLCGAQVTGSLGSARGSEQAVEAIG